jgi:hypothetical protein
VAPHRDSELPGLVGEVGGDAGAGEGDETSGQRFEHLIVAFEGRGLGVPGPVGLEDDLRDLVVIGPTGGDALGTLGAAAMQQHHVRVLGARLVEHGPDAVMIVAVHATGEGDARSGRNAQLGLGEAAGGEVVAAVDHSGGEGAVVDDGARARAPDGAGGNLEEVGGVVAEGFFAKLTRQRLKRSVFRGIVDLQAAINRYLAETNQNPMPFTWTADPDAIIDKVRRGKQALESVH